MIRTLYLMRMPSKPKLLSHEPTPWNFNHANLLIRIRISSSLKVVFTPKQFMGWTATLKQLMGVALPSFFLLFNILFLKKKKNLDNVVLHYKWVSWSMIPVDLTQASVRKHLTSSLDWWEIKALRRFWSLEHPLGFTFDFPNSRTCKALRSHSNGFAVTWLVRNPLRCELAY